MKSIDEEALAVLSDDVGALWCRRVAVLDSPPDSLTFLRGAFGVMASSSSDGLPVVSHTLLFL